MLNEKQIHEIEDALEKVELTEDTLPFFLYIFETCNEPFITNILAYKFEDLKDDRVIPYLIKHLQNIKTYMYRGNVLSALREFDYRPYADLLINLFATGNYEVSIKAASMLLDIKDQLTSKQKEALEKLIKERTEILNDSIEYFTDVSTDLDLNMEL